MIPFDRELRRADRRGVRGGGADRPAGRDRGLGGRELPLRQGGEGRRRASCARATSSRRASCRWSRSRARPSPRPTSAGWSRPARSRQAAEFLGGPFLLEGEVVHGDQRGRELGMPTANIVPDDAFVCPGHGVYAAWAHGTRRPSTWACGPPSRPAAGCWSRRYLIDFDGDLYGRDAADRLRRAAARREALRVGRRAGRADAARRRAGAEICDRRLSAWLLPFPADDADRGQKREIVAEYGSGDDDTGSTEVQIALLTARINELTEHLREHTQGPPLAPRPADAGRQAPPAAQLPAAQRPRPLPRADRGARPAPMIEPGAQAPDFTLPDQDGQRGLAGRPARPDDRARLLPARLQPGLHRPAERLPGGARRARGARREAATASRSTRPSATRPSSEHLGISIPLLADFHPKGEVAQGLRRLHRGARRRRARARDDRPRRHGASGRTSRPPLEIPGANLIFDALGAQRDRPPEPGAGRPRPRRRAAS